MKLTKEQIEAKLESMEKERAEKRRDDLNCGRVVTNERMNLVPIK